MKKAISFLAALSILTSAVSCGKKPTDSSVGDTVTEQVQLISFKSADINMAEDFSEIVCTDKRMANFLIFGKLDSGEYSGYITNTEFAEKRSFTFTPARGETVKTAALMPFGKAAVLTVLGEHTFIYTFDSKGSPENTFDLGAVIGADDHYTELLCTEGGFYINIDRYALAYADNDGNFRGNISVSGRNVCGVVNDSGDTPCVLLSDGGKTVLCRLDEGNIVEETDCGELADYTNCICTGLGEYTIAAVVNSGLYGLKENSWVKLTDFSDNDFNISALKDIEMTAENEFSAVVSKDGVNFGMRLLSQRDISEIKAKSIIKLANVAVTEYDPYDDLIKKYNSESESNKIEVVQYVSMLYEDAMNDLALDIIAGNAPDIIIFNSDSPIESFGSRESIFADMYRLMDKDEDISRGDFLEGFLEGLETNGKLLQIAQSFDVESLMIKEKYAEGLTSWSLGELESIYKKHSDDMDISYDAPYLQMESMLSSLFWFSRFYDKKTAECRFDSPEFIDAMKFVKNNKIGISPEELSYISSFGGEDEEINAFRKDRVLIQRADIGGYPYLRKYLQVYSNEPVTFMGFPDDKGANAISSSGKKYGIMANSKNIEGAWDFLKYYLFSEDSYNYFENYGLFPGLEKFYNEQLDYHCTYHTYIDPETGEEKNADAYAYQPEGSMEYVTVEFQPFTAEERKKYDTFVRNALKNPVRGDHTIHNIVTEEAAAYYAGERTAEEAAAIIQNRVTIYLSEQS